MGPHGAQLGEHVRGCRLAGVRRQRQHGLNTLIDHTQHRRCGQGAARFAQHAVEEEAVILRCNVETVCGAKGGVHKDTPLASAPGAGFGVAFIGPQATGLCEDTQGRRRNRHSARQPDAEPQGGDSAGVGCGKYRGVCHGEVGRGNVAEGMQPRQRGPGVPRRGRVPRADPLRHRVCGVGRLQAPVAHTRCFAEIHKLDVRTTGHARQNGAQGFV